MDIQQILDNVPENGTAELPPGEYEGTFFIRKSCCVAGKDTILWNVSGPVVVAEAEGIKLRDISIELTGGELPPEKNVSVYCRFPDTEFSGVRVSGAVIGIEKEEKFWGLPGKLSLGLLPAEKETEFSFEIYSPAAARISCGAYGIRLLQEDLSEGYNDISFTVGKTKSGIIIYGEILVESAVTRKIIISGETGGTDAAAPQDTRLFTVDREAPEIWDGVLENFNIDALTAAPKYEQVSVVIPEDNDVHIEEINESALKGNVREENIFLVSGETVPLAPKKYCIELEYSSSRVNMDIDGYLFMLGDSGRVENNSDMIFFGNDHSRCGSVKYINTQSQRSMVIDLRTIPDNINRMAMLFSIYGDSPMQTFDKLVNGEVSVLCENGVHLHLRLDPDLNRRTVLAFGFEKKDGVWELIPSGKGVAMPLEDICRSYGVQVIS